MKQIYVLGLLLSMCVKLSCIYEARHTINTNEDKIRTLLLCRSRQQTVCANEGHLTTIKYLISTENMTYMYMCKFWKIYKIINESCIKIESQ